MQRYFNISLAVAQLLLLYTVVCLNRALDHNHDVQIKTMDVIHSIHLREMDQLEMISQHEAEIARLRERVKELEHAKD